MDTLRGNFGHLSGDTASEDESYLDDDYAAEPPPSPVGQDERRMQVRAYNHWASLLDERNFPSINDLKPDKLPDFGPFSVLLDFSNGIEDPGVSYLGQEIAEECGTQTGIGRLADIPSRSLLSRITDHYMQILANQAPIGFEAEFVNQREKTILYRGILLPFSSDDETIDFIYGVINWKELADAKTTDDLLLEIDQALAQEPEPVEEPAPAPVQQPIADWADGPTSETHDAQLGTEDEDDVFDLYDAIAPEEDPNDPVAENFGSLTGGGFSAGKSMQKRDALTDAQPADVEEPVVEFPVEDPEPPHGDAFDRAKLMQGDESADLPEAPETGALNAIRPDFALESSAQNDIELSEFAPETLADWLALARESASEARATEDRSRRALYEAIGQAYDFALAVDQAPDEYAEILSDAGLDVQDRAPMTPIVKLVFGVDYDKTRLTEYAAALSFAKREGVAQGDMATFVSKFDGGLKGVVAAERAVRRADSGKPAKAQPAVRGKIAKTLRTMDAVSLDSIEAQGEEFALVMVRREADGSLSVIGEVPADNALVAKAARKLAESAN